MWYLFELNASGKTIPVSLLIRDVESFWMRLIAVAQHLIFIRKARLNLPKLLILAC